MSNDCNAINMGLAYTALLCLHVAFKLCHLVTLGMQAYSVIRASMISDVYISPIVKRRSQYRCNLVPLHPLVTPYPGQLLIILENHWSSHTFYCFFPPVARTITILLIKRAPLRTSIRKITLKFTLIKPITEYICMCVCTHVLAMLPLRCIRFMYNMCYSSAEAHAAFAAEHCMEFKIIIKQSIILL